MRILFAVTWLLFCLSCDRLDPERRESPSIDRYEDMHESLRYRGLLSEAIDLANLIAGASVEYTLCRGWEGPTYSSIPVHAVQSEMLDETDVSFVPNPERSIFVNVDGVPYLTRQLAADAPGVVSVDISHLVAVVLLHELGHIANGDAGEFSGSGNLTRLDVETVEAQARHMELTADRFAADCIRRAKGSSKIKYMLAGTNLAVSVSLISWNICAARMNNSLGALVIGSREATWDRGYTHPNLELRFLITNHYVLPTNDSRKLLEDFLRARERAHDPVPIYDPEDPVEP